MRLIWRTLLGIIVGGALFAAPITPIILTTKTQLNNNQINSGISLNNFLAPNKITSGVQGFEGINHNSITQNDSIIKYNNDLSISVTSSSINNKFIKILLPTTVGQNHFQGFQGFSNDAKVNWNMNENNDFDFDTKTSSLSNKIELSDEISTQLVGIVSEEISIGNNKQTKTARFNLNVSFKLAKEKKIPITSKKVDASSLGIPGIIGANIPKINTKFLLDNKDKFLNGTLSLITSESDFIDLNVAPKGQTELTVTFKIAANKSYNNDESINTKPVDIKLDIPGFIELNQESFAKTIQVEFNTLLRPKTFETPADKYINLGDAQINNETMLTAVKEFMANNEGLSYVRIWNQYIYIYGGWRPDNTSTSSTWFDNEINDNTISQITQMMRMWGVLQDDWNISHIYPYYSIRKIVDNNELNGISEISLDFDGFGLQVVDLNGNKIYQLLNNITIPGNAELIENTGFQTNKILKIKNTDSGTIGELIS